MGLPLKSISRDGNTVTIVTAKDKTRTIDLSALNLNLSTTQLENLITAAPKLENELANVGVYVHIYSKSPLDFVIRITDGTEAPPPDGWWQ